MPQTQRWAVLIVVVLLTFAGGGWMAHDAHQRPHRYYQRLMRVGGMAYLRDVEPRVQASVMRGLGLRPFSRVHEVHLQHVGQVAHREDRHPLDDPAAHDAEVLVMTVAEGDEAVVEGLENMVRLRDVAIWGDGLRADVFAKLADMRLSELHLSTSPRLSDEGFEQVFVGELTSLSIEWTAMGDDAVRHLAEARRLETLHLRGSLVTGASMSALAKLPRLRGILLGDTRLDDAGLASLAKIRSLEYLDLEGTKITDAGIAHLAGHPTLRMLHLGGTAVTDAAIPDLESMPDLRGATLWHNRMTEAGAKSLHRTLERRPPHDERDDDDP